MNKVLVTGGSSMIGRATIKFLKERGFEVLAPNSVELDLLIEEVSDSYFVKNRDFKYVIHLAGFNGGIQFNKQYPYGIYTTNTYMLLNLFDNIPDVDRVFSIIASCAYPDNGDEVLQEKDFWNGLPNKTVDCHGLAKRNLHAISMQVNKQAGYNKAVCGVLTNCYGPYDSYREEKTKVVGGMIKRFCEAEENNREKITCWGTGKPRRELMYAEDAGWLIANIFDKNIDEDLINIGTGTDISIKDLASVVKEKTGYKGEIEWDTTKPDGQMKKLLDNSKIKKYLPEYSPTPIDIGIEKTVKWYKDNKLTWKK